jgi:hypothetical protein
MIKLLSSLLPFVAMLAAGPALGRDRDDPSVQLAKIIGDRVPGKPVDCINLSSITSSQIISGKAIIYVVGNRLYVNEPRSGASSLEVDDILVTRTPGSQLCSIDTVNLVDRGSRFNRGFVSLGQFIPYAKVRNAD